jgi:hypothetical protein
MNKNEKFLIQQEKFRAIVAYLSSGKPIPFHPPSDSDAICYIEYVEGPQGEGYDDIPIQLSINEGHLPFDGQEEIIEEMYQYVCDQEQRNKTTIVQG